MNEFISVDSNIKSAVKSTKQISKVIPKATSAALNRAGQRAKTEAVRKTREIYNITAKTINQTIRIKRSTVSNLTLELKSKGPNIPLIRFKTTPSKPSARQPKVLKAAVKKGAKKPIPGAFVAQAGAHIGVFERKGRGRLPIVELRGPAVPVMMNNDEVVEAAREAYAESFSERLPHEIDRLLGRLSL